MTDSTPQSATDAAGDVSPSRYLILFFGALVALGPLSIDSYLPAIPAIADDFGVGIVQVNNTVSIFLLGYAFGQFFGGAFSDQIGRKRVGMLGMSVYVLTTFSIVFVHSVDTMLLLRFFQAIGGGFSTVICMASIRDIYPVEQLGRRFATVMMVMLISPLLAPTLGSLLLPFGWQSIFLFKASYAAVLFTVYSTLIPESRPGRRWSDLSVRSIFIQCGRVATRRVDGRILPIRYAVAMALAVSVLMVFVTNASFVYIEYFKVSPTQFPLYFGLSVLGFMSMNFYCMKRLDSSNAGTIFRRALRVQVFAVAGLFVVVNSTWESLWTVVPFVVLGMSMLGLVGPAGSSRYMSFFRELAGSASSVYTTMMFSFGAILGALTGVFYDGTLGPMVDIMLAASIIANLIVLSIPVGRVASHELS
jgi:DHA1 family bicyclomycin/chloramphenicol resistance-like MFS transporter